MPDSAATDLVEYVCQDHVATITLNRPEKLNAFNDELVIALGDAFRRLDGDEDA
jgi:E-phenylitaconyl-CoA hydratase